MAMANYKLILEYDGTAYNGFQIQNNGITIQGSNQHWPSWPRNR